MKAIRGWSLGILGILAVAGTVAVGAILVFDSGEDLDTYTLHRLSQFDEVRYLDVYAYPTQERPSFPSLGHFGPGDGRAAHWSSVTTQYCVGGNMHSASPYLRAVMYEWYGATENVTVTWSGVQECGVDYLLLIDSAGELRMYRCNGSPLTIADVEACIDSSLELEPST